LRSIWWEWTSNRRRSRLSPPAVPGCIENPRQTATLAQGETATLDVGCATVEFQVSANQVLVRIGQSAPLGAVVLYNVNRTLLVAPELGQPTTPLVFDGGQGCGAGNGVESSVGGILPSPGGSPEKFMTVALAGDAVVGGNAPDCVVPDGLTAVLSIWSVGAGAQPVTQCSDGIDNDVDGAIDLNDRQCKSAADTSESHPGPH